MFTSLRLGGEFRHRTFVGLSLRISDAIFGDVRDQPVHLLDLAALRRDDAIGQLADAQIVDFGAPMMKVM